ncbi:MAG: type II toxin-antitoxin system VapC family toxin [Alphaproteobacteria bacterium]|nr:MAG: type II toxin-antitoxin system VapC family toxin [Alphaproteobacteria bacterium]
MALLLDTCAVVWAGNGDRLADAAIAAINDDHARGEALQVSPITAWELGMLVARGRLRLARGVTSWFATFLDRSTARLAGLTPATLIASSFLPETPPRDPADRIIIATAREEGMTILTRDRRILDYAAEGHVQALEC